MSYHPLNLNEADFPIRKNLVYLNHAGTAPMPRQAADMMKQFADEVSGFSSAIYPEWTKRIEHTRALAAKLIGSEIGEIAFTKSTTGGLNCIAYGIDWKPGDVIIAEEKTFPSNWLPWKWAEKYGAEVRVWPERNFRYELEDLEALLKQGNVRMVAATSANFATGFRSDLEAIGKLCRQYGALYCVDIIQTLGVFPVDVKACGIDFLSADSHKWLMGPEGSALFYVAKDKLPLFDDRTIGWLGRDEFWIYDQLDHKPFPSARRFEEGAPNVPGIMAMGESLKLILSVGVDHIAAHNRALCAVLEDGLLAQGWQVRSPRDASASSIVSAIKDGLDYNVLAKAMMEAGPVFVVSRRGALRLSPHFYQTKEDMQRAVEVLARV